jgi:hypothetical protein
VERAWILLQYLGELRKKLPEWGFSKMPRRSVPVPGHILGKLEHLLDEGIKEETNGLPDIDMMDIAVMEGGKKWVIHLRRERNQKIVQSQERTSAQ